jgi:hypothetical protein
VQGAVRRALLLAAALLGAACASVAPPPGGPEDRTAPRLLSVSPDSGAVGIRARDVTFRFDEVISDRPQGATDLAGLVILSPRDGAPRVRWSREEIRVRPRDGWRPNTTYSITLLPGVSDLRGNVGKARRTVVVSTGPTMAQFEITGRIFDWPAERVAPGAVVEAVSLPDSVVYVGVADSVGGFAVGPLPGGSYAVRGFVDQNKNWGLDRGEAWDSTRVELRAQRTFVELLAAMRDTIPPRIAQLTLTDSATITIEFDRALEPGQAITPALFRVRGPDSTDVPIVSALTRGEVERQREEARRRADTTAARRDSLARRDSVARADSAAAAGRRQPAPPPKPSRPAPQTTVVLRLARPLAPGASYRVRVAGLRNLMGAAGTAERVLAVPRPAPPPAPSDTSGAARRPGAPPAAGGDTLRPPPRPPARAP